MKRQVEQARSDWQAKMRDRQREVGEGAGPWCAALKLDLLRAEASSAAG